MSAKDCEWPVKVRHIFGLFWPLCDESNIYFESKINMTLQGKEVTIPCTMQKQFSYDLTTIF